jgi:hypothetical protein
MNINALEQDKKPIDSRSETQHSWPRAMITSLHIENFRCFKSLDLKDFGKYNIIVGDNGSGKT